MKTHTPKEKLLNFRIDGHTFTMLENMAEEQFRTVSNLARKYVEEGLKKDSRKRKKAVQ